MINQYNNKAESVSGRLLQFLNVWKVQSGCGTFPLSQKLQSKPTTDLNGAMVTAVVQFGEVVDYHFSDETID